MDRSLALEPTQISTGWEDVLIAEGMKTLGLAFESARANKWVESWLDHHLSLDILYEKTHIHTGSGISGVRLNPYCGNWGLPLVSISFDGKQYTCAYEAETKQVADHIIQESPRWHDGTIRHAEAAGAWVDTLYYSAAPLAKAYAFFKDSDYANEAMDQCLLHAKHLRDTHTSLFFHDRTFESKVRSTSFWGRGQGWVILSFAEVLYYLDPNDTSVDENKYDEVRAIYQDLAGDLLRYQHPSGMWRTVPENCDSPLETSASTMITAGIVKGIAAGVLEPSLIVGAQKSLQELISYIYVRPNHMMHGALSGSQFAAGVGGWEVQKFIPSGEITYTTGLFLKLLGEMELLGGEVPLNMSRTKKRGRNR